ncbi:hypothetical protein GLAREA_09132 [Glarea lozoyensis ATCC 20868]|uniref:Uncharacterized protein n=1 Tax=Glarea lozoyensis (strain ATCC 20868 / MF5171) TaxID=1116229 RepID=S3DII2_GLAL2|nr:uncharacterized protein GLAREA_09132 [Glarea lozoyensis ATCC 20868]EPE36969.1 hypothetical protein GLAREA_09132 [Glarea lozoyensis ATCC 20868]
MPSTENLKASVFDPIIDEETKACIVNSLWGLDSGSSHHCVPKTASNYGSYFNYYMEQCDTAGHDNRRYLSVRTHQDVVDIVNHIKTNINRDDLSQVLKAKWPHPDPRSASAQIDGSIDLAARLLLMIDVGDLKHGFRSGNRLIWDGGSLKSLVHSHYNTAQSLHTEHVRLEKIFNARNLVRIGGFKIEWTNNLADHLRILNDDEKKVAIFSNFSFLKVQENSPMFPDGLIDETLRTLALLLPRSDVETRKWYRKVSNKFLLDPQATQCNSLRLMDRHIDRFHFWRDRIVVLKEMFDEAEPRTLLQWWSDRRNVVQWYTFWVAGIVLVLTFVFGLIQCIEGGIQVYFAFPKSPA